MRRALLTVAVLAGTAVLGGAARADGAVLGVGRTCDKDMSCSYVVSYTADPGERNDARIVRRDSSLAVSDSGASIRAATGCSGGGSHVVTCGGGTDTASFDERRTGVRADLRAGTATAARGERDTLANVESLRGGPGDDVLLGDGGANELRGGGDDELRGRGGVDSLFGPGRLDGGAGDDLLRLAGHGRAICGAGGGDLVGLVTYEPDGRPARFGIPAAVLQQRLRTAAVVVLSAPS